MSPSRYSTKSSIYSSSSDDSDSEYCNNKMKSHSVTVTNESALLPGPDLDQDPAENFQITANSYGQPQVQQPYYPPQNPNPNHVYAQQQHPGPAPYYGQQHPSGPYGHQHDMTPPFSAADHHHVDDEDNHNSCTSKFNNSGCYSCSCTPCNICLWIVIVFAILILLNPAMYLCMLPFRYRTFCNRERSRKRNKKNR